MKALALLAVLLTGTVVTRTSTTFEVWLSDGGRYGTVTKAQALAALAAYRAQNDGGTVREAVQSLGLMLLDSSLDVCSCSDGVGVCQMDPGDGGLVNAPLYQTNHGATGAGCQPMPCVKLWSPDGDAWPNACPLPAPPDGG